MPPGSRDGLLSRVAAPPEDRADLDRHSSRSFFEKDRHELVYQETSSRKGDMFTKSLGPSAFERALTLINLVRPDGSKYKAE